MVVAVAARNGSQAAFTEELAVAHGDDGFPALFRGHCAFHLALSQIEYGIGRVSSRGDVVVAPHSLARSSRLRFFARKGSQSAQETFLCCINNSTCSHHPPGLTAAPCSCYSSRNSPVSSVWDTRMDNIAHHSQERELPRGAGRIAQADSTLER